jgi:hypothetical protein
MPATLQYTDGQQITTKFTKLFATMLTKYGTGGINTSANSTTLQTIFFKLFAEFRFASR